MIEFASAADVRRLVDRVTTRISRYSDVVLCSPFIDEDGLDTLERLARSASDAGCGLGIITAQHSIKRVAARLGACRQTRLIDCPGLHAKFYLAVARNDAWTEAIVTSANLTTGGLTNNIELGVRIAATSPYGRALLHQIDHYARRLMINRRPPWKKH
jgi:HKD family nuclease